MTKLILLVFTTSLLVSCTALGLTQPSAIDGAHQVVDLVGEAVAAGTGVNWLMEGLKIAGVIVTTLLGIKVAPNGFALSLLKKNNPTS